MKTLSHRLPTKLTLGIAALVAACSSTFASLNYDVRVTALNGVLVPPGCAKEIGRFRLGLGDVLTFTVYAQVMGAAGNTGSEGFQKGYFSLVSSVQPGAILGHFSGGTVLPPFATSAFSGGTPMDTNVDGFFDRLGVGSTSASQNFGFHSDIVAFQGVSPSYSGVPIPDGMEFALVTADFRIMQVGGFLSVGLVPSIFTSGIGDGRFSAIWAEDAAGGAVPANRKGGFISLNPIAPNTGLITVSGLFPPLYSPLDCPEPSAFWMLLLGAMWVAGSRHFGMRHRTDSTQW